LFIGLAELFVALSMAVFVSIVTVALLILASEGFANARRRIGRMWCRLEAWDKGK
jgi:hypothetical protein